MLVKYVRFMIKNYLFALLALAFVCVYWLNAKDLPAKSLDFPKALLVVLIPLFLWNGINSVREFKKTCADTDLEETKKWNCSLHITKQKLVVTGMTLVYILLTPLIGFFVCTLIYLAALAFYLGIRKPLPLAFFTIFFTAILYGIFVFWLKVHMPNGILF